MSEFEKIYSSILVHHKAHVGCGELTFEACEAIIDHIRTQDFELARRDASLLTEGEQKEILSYIQGNYDRDKIPTWLLDLIDGITSRNEIIKRLKEDAERLATRAVYWDDYGNEYECIHLECGGHSENILFDHAPDCPITLHRKLMKELEC